MMIELIAAGAAAVVAAPPAGLFGYRQLKRTKNARALRIQTPNGIDEAGFVRIGGLDQWVSIRGEDLRNPVILEVLGGPGASNLIFIPRTREWEKHFTIVRWDMRGAGKTFAHGGPDGQGDMSMDRLYRDALEVADHVRARLAVDRLLLVANSFGTNLGLRLARNHPERFSAYVGTDQNINDGGRERSAYYALLERLEQKGKKKLLEEARGWGEDKSRWTPKQWSEYAKLCVTSDPLTYDTMKIVVIRSLWFTPLFDLRGLKKYLAAMNFSERIAPQAVGIDERAEGTSFGIPVFLFQGEHDALTPPLPVKRFYDLVDAPVKDFALIEGCSHFASFRNPDRFLELMISKVRPVLAADTTPRVTVAE
ncbi:MAG: alpha/beta hydrolase [Catenulispora sp.]|nr:alpha/beta hydrolase [Catenulispora sp.]